MIKRLTYRQKNYLLLFGCLVLGWAIYQLSISKTLEEVRSYNQLMAQIEVGNSAHSMIFDYKKKLKFYEDHLGSFETDSMHNHEHVLVAVSHYCQRHNLTVESFPSELVEDYSDFNLHTHKIEVRGNFKELLHLIYHLERVEKLGRIASLELEKKLDKKTKRTILTASIYIQNTAL